MMILIGKNLTGRELMIPVWRMFILPLHGPKMEAGLQWQQDCPTHQEQYVQGAACYISQAANDLNDATPVI